MRTSKIWILISVMDVWQILATFPMNPNNQTQKTFNILFFRFPQGTCPMPFQMFLQIACRSIVALASIVWFPPIVCFQMSSQIACLRAYKITLVALVICLTFPRRGFSNVSSNCLPEQIHNHIGCICLTYHHYASWNVSSTRLHKMMQSHNGCTCSTFLQCVFSNVYSNCLDQSS